MYTASIYTKEHPISHMKKALITGITGQDGSYLAELLLEKGYEVHGIKRRNSILATDRVDHLYSHPVYKDNLHLHYGDLSDPLNIVHIISKVKPDEIYNLAAMSHVKVSFEKADYTGDIDALGTLRILEALRILDMTHVKFYQASSSEMFGKVQETPQTEKTPFYPRSPYGCAKVFGYWITINYRESYGMFACNGILFNHESPRRGETFVTRKITRSVAMIAHGKEEVLYLGNLDSQRDWGHAKDYVEAMWMMMQHEKADDYVIATGRTTTVREFAQKAFACAGIKIEFSGEGIDEVGTVVHSEHPTVEVGRVVLRISEKYFRPAEVDLLLGDATKAQNTFGWKPKYDLDMLVAEMVKSDMRIVAKGIHTDQFEEDENSVL